MGQEVPRIERLGASVAAIAVTATFSQMAFAEHLGVTFPLLSDWGGATAEAYGVRYDVWKGHEGLAKRSVFVIDRDATIRSRWVTDDALVEPDFDEAIAVLEALADGDGG
ncbi:MAG TPA: redoxin domain-containing protein [Actinomycetota bacterium]